jgi:Na+/H+-dicarboxylate symporter
VSTTALAVLVGLVVVNTIRPGIGTVDQTTLDAIRAEGGATVVAQQSASIRVILENLLLMLFTDNLISSAAETNLLPLIVFSIIFGGMLTTMGERVRAITQMIVQVNDALLSFIMLLMNLAPLGIFCLVTARFGQAQAEGQLAEVISQTGWYFLTVILGLVFHALITLSLILWLFTRRNPYRFIYQMSQALLTAFSTASSSATLPVTMDCAIKRAGISKRSTEFVLPLGATINMDGTALYEAAAAIFIAQAIGMDLGLMAQATIAVTATLAAIGAAGIPEAGLVTMVIVLNAVGLPVEYIGLILSVDWLLDRFRTSVNAFGDAVGAAVVEKAFGTSGDR